MYRTATVNIIDVIDTVHIHAVVRLWDGIQTGSPATELTCTVDVDGVGRGSGDAWLRDALVALLEAV